MTVNSSGSRSVKRLVTYREPLSLRPTKIEESAWERCRGLNHLRCVFNGVIRTLIAARIGGSTYARTRADVAVSYPWRQEVKLPGCWGPPVALFPAPVAFLRVPVVLSAEPVIFIQRSIPISACD